MMVMKSKTQPLQLPDAVAEKQGIWTVRAERFSHLYLPFPPRVIPEAAESFTGLPVTPNSPIVKLF